MSFTGAYYCLNMIMITLSTFLAVIVIHLYFRGPRTNRVPYWVKRVRQLIIISHSLSSLIQNLYCSLLLQVVRLSMTCVGGSESRIALLVVKPALDLSWLAITKCTQCACSALVNTCT